MIEITRLIKSGGPLTKRISLAADGTLCSDGSACVMSEGRAQRAIFGSLAAFATSIRNLKSNEAIALGTLNPDLPETVEITTKRRLQELNGAAALHLIARTSSYITYRRESPALALIDIDTKGIAPAVSQRVKAHGGYWAALVSVLPELQHAARVLRRSTTTGISRADTGEAFAGSAGMHIFVLVEDGTDIERFLGTLHARCWLRGLGWMMVGAAGQLLERSLVDRMVYAPERIVFEGAPLLVPPLVQDASRRSPDFIDGGALDTRTVCLDLTEVEMAKMRGLRTEESRGLAPAADGAKAKFINAQARSIASRTNYSAAMARHVAELQLGGTLLPNVALWFDDPDLKGSTVGDVLRDPDRFVDATLPDPLEGVDYGMCKAKVMRRPDGTLWIHSFAHGRTTYELKHDAVSVEAALRACEPSQAADLFVRLLLSAELAADEEQRLRELTCELSGTKARPLGAQIKIAREQQGRARAQEARQRRATERRDKRLRIAVPLPDAERLPVLRTLDEILSNTGEAEPPMRDMDGIPVEVRCRPSIALHELCPSGSNQMETDESRLPSPEIPLLTRHTKYTLSQEIERHVAFVAESTDGEERAVALPPVFVEHYLTYRDSTLPRVGAVVTAPLVLPDGTLLASHGLDRQRQLVFRIDPALIALLPNARDCESSRTVADALEYLVDEWLCDVATDFVGKCVLIALALTILERALLPERPAFFVTAGRRGGGKTTALTMVILAATGMRPAAAAWSSNDEERRKAMMAHLSDGLAALVWDNIPHGTVIECSTLEKVLTAASFTDRVLGESVSATVPTHTVMALTGNNIGPNSDLASRSLTTRLDVDRPDPENRPFRHTDPVAWTLSNRGDILASLYTILLGNPQLQPEGRKTPKTRFKTWWHLIGSAVEHAAECLVEKQKSFPLEWRTATQVDVAELFAAVEREDEDTAQLAEVLEILNMTWPNKFLASYVAEFINQSTDREDERVGVLRSYFETPTRRGPGTITSKSIGRRLNAVVDAPVWVRDSTMKLTRTSDDKQKKQKLPTWFEVKIVG